MTENRERPCVHCGQLPLQHSAHYMFCFDRAVRRWLDTQYAPDATKLGIVPSHKPASIVHLCAFPRGVDDATVRDLTAQMMQARASRDYKLADSIRAVLRAAGVDVINAKARKPA
jgi:cysteinyl-tRNA synthetase